MTRLDSLTSVVREYIASNDLCHKQAERLIQHVKDFDSWHAMRDFVPDGESDSARVNAWSASLVAAGLAPSTVNNHVTTMKTLLRFATPDNEPLPRLDKIRRQKEPETIKPAYRLEEIRQLIAAAPDYKPPSTKVYGRGQRRRTVERLAPDGVPWGVRWEAVVRVAYGSGQYLSDLRCIPWEAVQPDGMVTFCRHKTGKLITFRLNDAAIASARRIGHPELLLPWEFDTRAYFAREWRKFCQFAEVRSLGPKSIRRCAITQVYMAQGEEAARQLAGHSSFAITSRHYIDWSQAGKPVVVPPEI